MYREKLTIYDVGMTLDANGKLAFCKEAEGHGVTNLIVEFEWEHEGKDEAGRETFGIKFISSAWFHAQERNTQHFTGTLNGKLEENPLHVAALYFASEHYMDEILEKAQASFHDIREHERYLDMAA